MVLSSAKRHFRNLYYRKSSQNVFSFHINVDVKYYNREVSCIIVANMMYIWMYLLLYFYKLLEIVEKTEFRKCVCLASVCATAHQKSLSSEISVWNLFALFLEKVLMPRLRLCCVSCCFYSVAIESVLPVCDLPSLRHLENKAHEIFFFSHCPSPEWNLGAV